jgi:hypothetical protein
VYTPVYDFGIGFGADRPVFLKIVLEGCEGTGFEAQGDIA